MRTNMKYLIGYVESADSVFTNKDSEENYRNIGYDTIKTCKTLQTFRRNLLTLS